MSANSEIHNSFLRLSIFQNSHLKKVVIHTRLLCLLPVLRNLEGAGAWSESLHLICSSRDIRFVGRTGHCYISRGTHIGS
jgi:hypothetical protein